MAESSSFEQTLPEWQEAKLPDESWGSWLLTGLGMGLDVVLLRAMKLVIDAALTPAPGAVPALRAAAQPYLEADLQRNPRQFFSFIDTKPAPLPGQVAERLRQTLPGGMLVSRQFLSNYERYYEPEVDTVGLCVENGRIPVEHWMHESGKPAGTVVVLHGFSMGQPLIDSFVLMASEWYNRGLDVAMMTLPYHGARAPRNARFSGELFASPDAGRLNEAVRQAVHDAHMIMNWARRETGAPVGLLGLSLGGYISSLIAGLTSDPAFVIPIVPPVDLADLAWRSFITDKNFQEGAKPPLTREEHYAVYRIHSPLTYPLQVPKERLLIVAGRGDRVVPPEHPHALWKHWGKPAIHWFSGSHIAPFRRQRIVAVIDEHFRSLGIL